MEPTVALYQDYKKEYILTLNSTPSAPYIRGGGGGGFLAVHKAHGFGALGPGWGVHDFVFEDPFVVGAFRCLQLRSVLYIANVPHETGGGLSCSLRDLTAAVFRVCTVILLSFGLHVSEMPEVGLQPAGRKLLSAMLVNIRQPTVQVYSFMHQQLFSLHKQFPKIKNKLNMYVCIYTYIYIYTDGLAY